MALLEKLGNHHAGVRGLDTVIAHLNHLLNSVTGISAINPEFGVDSAIALGENQPEPAPRSPLERLRLEFERAVRFEPALVDVQLNCMPKRGVRPWSELTFRLVASLLPAYEPVHLLVRFDFWTRKVLVEKEVQRGIH